MDWYPRYPALWRSKTRHLDPFQEGCYLRLVDEYMETRQPLPDNDQALARIIGISVEAWLRDASGIVRAFFNPQKGLLFHDRCDKILSEQDQRSIKQSEKSKKGAQARWNKTNNIDALGSRQAMPNYATGQDKTGKKKESPLPPLFEKFWEIYPKTRRGSKEKALNAYRKALTRDTEENIYEGTRRYAASDEVARGFGKGAEAWLNDDRWRNDYEPPKVADQNNNGPKLTNYERALMAGLRKGSQD